MKKFRVVKSYSVYEYAIVEAASEDEAWDLADEQMDEYDWEPCSVAEDWNADEQVIDVQPEIEDETT